MAPPLEDPPARGEFSLLGVPAFKLTACCQEPEQWEPDMCDEEGIEHANEVILIVTLKALAEVWINKKNFESKF